MGNIKFLKEDGEDFEIGDTVTFEYTVKGREPFEDTRTLEDPETIEISVEGYQNNLVVEGQSMTKNAVGEYFYNWDTSNLDAGDYKVTVFVSGGGSSDEENDWIRLTD